MRGWRDANRRARWAGQWQSEQTASEKPGPREPPMSGKTQRVESQVTTARVRAGRGAGLPKGPAAGPRTHCRNSGWPSPTILHASPTRKRRWPSSSTSSTTPTATSTREAPPTSPSSGSPTPEFYPGERAGRPSSRPCLRYKLLRPVEVERLDADLLPASARQ